MATSGYNVGQNFYKDQTAGFHQQSFIGVHEVPEQYNINYPPPWLQPEDTEADLYYEQDQSGSYFSQGQGQPQFGSYGQQQAMMMYGQTPNMDFQGQTYSNYGQTGMNGYQLQQQPVQQFQQQQNDVKSEQVYDQFGPSNPSQTYHMNQQYSGFQGYPSGYLQQQQQQQQQQLVGQEDKDNQLDLSPTRFIFNLLNSAEVQGSPPESPQNGGIAVQEQQEQVPVAKKARMKNASGESPPKSFPDVTVWDNRIMEVITGSFCFGKSEWTINFDDNQELRKIIFKGRLQTVVSQILQFCLGNDLSYYTLSGSSYVQGGPTNASLSKIQGQKLPIPRELRLALVSFFDSILPLSYYNFLFPNFTVEKMVRQMISRTCSRCSEAKNRKNNKK